MNILKTLRKPYFSIFYASLILITSCSSPANDNEIVENTISIEKFAQQHFELSNSLLSLLENESNINYDSLISSLNDVKNLDELKILLNDSNVNQTDELIEIIKMQEYNKSLLFESDRDYTETNMEELIVKQLDLLYDAQLEEKLMSSNNYLSRCCMCTCRDNWERGQNRCARNYAISTAVTWIAGGFTLGIGTAVGSIATAAYYVNCMAETQSDAEECNSNC